MASKTDESNLTNNCWWSDEVLSPDNSSTIPFRDFVLISEFSELEGPLPLAVVADSSYIDLKHYTDKQSVNTNEYKSLEKDLQQLGLQTFDFNAFVLRVVSVDRSTELEQFDEETPMTPSSLFEETPKPYLFSIPDDTQVYFTDSENNFFAFTHHLTLFDINARGYVHPVALSYITRDPNKILIRFEELMEKFNEVSLRLKKGNYSNFTLDLKCRLLDLEYTQSTSTTYTPTCNKPALSIQAIQQAITATKLMIDTLESTSSQINNITSTVDPPPQQPTSADTKMRYPPKDYKPKYIDTLYPVAHFERKLRSLAQLCQEPDEEDEDNSKHHIKRPSFTQKTATMIPLVFSMIEHSPAMSTSSSTATTTPSTIAQRPTFANTIAHNMYTEAIKYMQDMTRYFGKSSVVLDVEEEDNLFVDPISSALTIGRTFMLNVDNPQPREPVPNSPGLKEDMDKEKMTPSDNASQVSIASESLWSKSNREDEKVLDSKNDDELYYPLLFSPSQLWQCNEKTFLLEVLRRYQSLIVDVIFSLLTGRTVLIQGSADNKSLVQKVVRALSVFVPGQNRDRHQIIDWFEETRLTDTKIKSIKLVGIDKDNMDPSIHIDSSCVLDVDIKNGSLNSSPVYVEGQWINQLLDRIMLFSSDESYLAYLHTVFMTMSLKAFIYHHLYVNDEFKLDESPPSTFSSMGKGYTSETNSESSTVSRKWSVRLMNYLKKHEDTTSNASESEHSVTASEHSASEYSDENQATVTLQNVQENKPPTVVGLFEPPPENTTRRGSVSTAFSSRRSSISDDDDELDFGADDLLDFGNNSGNDDSSDEEGTDRYREQGPDGVSYIEREGRRYLQEKLKLYGDDQTIVVYLATCVLNNENKNI